MSSGRGAGITMTSRRHPLHSPSTCPWPARSHGMWLSLRRRLRRHSGESRTSAAARDWATVPLLFMPSPSTAQPQLAAALLVALEGELVFPRNGLQRYPNTFCTPLSSPGALQAPGTTKGPAKGPTLGSRGRFWAGGWVTAQAAHPACPLAPHSPGAAGAALPGSARCGGPAESARAQL